MIERVSLLGWATDCPIETQLVFESGWDFNSSSFASWLCNLGLSIFSRLVSVFYKVDGDISIIQGCED